MPKITVLPNPEVAPDGAQFEVESGANLARALIAHGVKVQHACAQFDVFSHLPGRAGIPDGITARCFSRRAVGAFLPGIVTRNIE